MPRSRTLATTVWCVLMSVSTALGEAPPPVKAPTSKPPKLKEKKLGTIKNVHALGDLYLAGQPSREDLDLLKQLGIKTIINVRKASEVPWDEAKAVKQLGMRYVTAPFQGADELKPEVFTKIRKVLNDKKRGPTVFHCGSANRVGAIWYAHRVLDAKLLPEAALAEAKLVGLRTPAYLERAQAYVESVQKEKEEPPKTSR